MEPMRGRSLQEARRLELGLVALRWLVVIFGTARSLLDLREGTDAPDYVVPLELALIAGLAIGNLFVADMARRADRVEQLRPVGLVAFALDVVVVLGLVWTSTERPADPIWVIGYILPLEGAARYGVAGALSPVLLYLASEIAREAYLADRFPLHAYAAPAVAFRAGMCFVVALVGGLFARGAQRETARGRERTRMAEEAAQLAERAARREAEARRDLVAFHTAILAGVAVEEPQEAMQAIAEAVGRELRCDAFAILLSEPSGDGMFELVAAGVHGDPGYARGTRFAQGTEPLGAGSDLGRPSLQRDPAEAVVPLRVDGEPIGILHEWAGRPGAIDRDRLLLLGRLADQVALVVQAARLRERQEETVRRLRELDEMKSDFVAITSHELRTPLTAVRGFVSALRRRMDELPPREVAEFLEIIDVQTERLIRLVEDLLVVSRIDAGHLAFVPEEVDLRSLIDRVILGLGDGAARVDRVDGPGLPSRITIDPQRLEQVLTNLLGNALKFAPVETRIELRGAMTSPGTVTFSVTDHGEGIPPGELELIFERFHQADASSTRRSDGAGLGLYIAKQLVEAMGGWIGVESELGTGSTFTVTLPAARALPEPAPLSRAAKAG
jgi:signal transduction histidine kinase